MKYALIVFILFVVVEAVVIAIYNKVYSKAKEENDFLKAENKRLKEQIKVINNAETKAKEDKKKINTDNDDDNFNASIDILSHDTK